METEPPLLVCLSKNTESPSILPEMENNCNVEDVFPSVFYPLFHKIVVAAATVTGKLRKA
jgi:hypothetical protein